jgi:endonuclease/exonuclease/phosphatase family metal-dependent hydrolase
MMPRRTFCLALAATATTAGCSTVPSTSPSPTLRILTYNLHHGEGTDGQLDLARIARVITESQADLIGLQEVDRFATRTGKVDQAAEYQRLTGLTGWYGAAMPFQGGEYGQLLLSRWPLLEPRVLRLPGTPGREPRIVTTVLVNVPRLGQVRFANAHFDASQDDGDRLQQAQFLLQNFPADGLPTLIVGDLNDTPESPTVQRLLQAGWQDTAGAQAAPTVPAPRPTSRIDYLLAAPAGRWETVQSEVWPESVASDHRAVVATLRRVGK